MKFKWNMITVSSMLLVMAGFYSAVTNVNGPLSRHAFFTFVGFLGWWIGNKLEELEGRLEELERKPSGQPLATCDSAPRRVV